MPKVLIVEDSAATRALIRSLLERAGHTAIEASDGAEGLRRLYSERPDLVLLDMVMPHVDGWQALERIRALTDVPILVCTGSLGDEDRSRVLRMGADDLVRKPFDGDELVARVEALLRRAGKASGQEIDVLDDGFARLDRARHEAVVEGRRLTLTPLEFRLLGAFLRHAGLALTHDQLLELVWQETGGTRDQVKAAVLSLRRKVAVESPRGDSVIETIRGVGYRWRTPENGHVSLGRS
jgi:DNA-binding response OmpR family regulator